MLWKWHTLKKIHPHPSCVVSKEKNVFFLKKGVWPVMTPIPPPRFGKKPNFLRDTFQSRPYHFTFFNSFCLEVGSVFFVLISLHFCFYEKQTAMQVVERQQRNKQFYFAIFLALLHWRWGVVKAFISKIAPSLYLHDADGTKLRKCNIHFLSRGAWINKMGRFFFEKVKRGGGFCNDPYKFITDFYLITFTF